MRRLVGAALLALLPVAAACGSSGGSSPAHSASPSGPVKVGRFTFPGGEPKGAPYTVYMIGTFANPNSGTPELPSAVKAVTAVVNSRLGGIAGHPLKLEFCDENSDPATATACINKAIAAKPLAIGGFPLVWDMDSRPAVTQAGILDISTSSAKQNYGADTTLFPAYGAAASTFAITGYARENNIKSVSIITLNIAPAVAGAKFLKTMLESSGVQVLGDPITHDPNAADMSTPIAKAMKGNPDMIVQINGPRECGRAVAAAAEQGYKGKIVLTPNCDRADVFKQAGAEGRKLIVTSGEVLLASPENPEIKFLKTALAENNGGVLTASTAQEAGALLTFVNVADQTAKANGQQLTSAALIDAYKNASNLPVFAGYVLDAANKPPIGPFDHLYNSYYRYFTLDDKSNLVDTGKWYSAFKPAQPGKGADAVS